MIILNDENFDKEVLNSDKPVLIDFFAEWCGPCQMLMPVVEQIAEENPDIKVGKIDIDQCSELAERYGVSAIPTLVVIKKGETVIVSPGMKSKDDILGLIGK